ncbi:selenophosphate synthase [Desulfonatronum thiosulfatophilum]|uniref:Selenophosphate synthase n=1 Tax=Desulfonatronum thiosulfatophilum TaxID=617002 RepID=A0A1G6BN31_9BACT|nr:selenophosphate synthase [Desulfonatronum thiosulfatophilum]
MRFPPGMALVQTVDFFTPIVNNPYWFGQIAAANSLSDIYAMGGEPLCAMNIVCFPIKTMSKDILKEILRGGLSKIQEAGAVLAGGHSVEDQEIKYGLSVSGVVAADGFATNGGLQSDDRLILTKPLGSGVLATGLKAGLPGADSMEELLHHWAARLNRIGGKVIAQLGLKGATDVTGFGLGGHLLEMAKASNKSIKLDVGNVPIMDKALELVDMGMLPAGSFANKKYCASQVHIESSVDLLRADLMFDAQTSGGLVLGVPEHRLAEARELLLEGGDKADVIGQVLPYEPGLPRLILS